MMMQMRKGPRWTAGVVLVLAGLVVSVHADNTDRSKAEPVCNRGDVLLCENWDDGDKVGWTLDMYQNSPASYGDVSCLAGNCVFGLPGHQSNRAILSYQLANQPSSLAPTARIAGAGLNDTLYLRANVYYSPGYLFHRQHQKMMYLWGMGSGGGKARIAVFVRADGSNQKKGIPQINLYCSYTDGTASECSGGGEQNMERNVGSVPFRMEGGRWHAVELMVQPNTGGATHNGSVKLWVNGQLLIDRANVSVRHAGETTPFNEVWLSSYWGAYTPGEGPATDQMVIYDDIVVSKSYIGPKGVLGPVPVDPVAPATLAAPQVSVSQ